ETFMTLGDSWSYAPNDNYKSAREVVRMLVDVVAKGGNLLLDVGPDGNGELPPVAVSRLHEIGLWMKVNGEAIYRTRKIAPYADGKFRFTSARDGTIYAIYLPDEKETELPRTLRIQVSPTSLEGSPQILGAKALLEWHGEGNAIVVDIPEAERQRSAGAYAWSFRLPARARALGSVR
ncbi:MAG TPA: alpha-L-fucosidase, partial [Sphingomicrobium sp.]|nr:alpha-L-fucosidase [Sphingomicrobium sp.]